MINGIIIKGIGGFYYIKTDEGIFECRARGKFRNESIAPKAGDNVQISIVDFDKKIGYIEKIYQRKNELIRPPVANIDLAFVVITKTSPTPNLLLIDKILSVTAFHKIETAIIINKKDLKDVSDLKKIYKSYKVFVTSAILNEGITEVLDYTKNKIAVFAGASGVGKSSIINSIGQYFIKTGEISEKIERGKHTTRHTELLPLENGGYIIDTPGFSRLDLEGIEYENLESCFVEFLPYLGKCKYIGCSHIKEQGCSVLEAVESGEIPKTRFESYSNLYTELKSINKWKK